MLEFGLRVMKFESLEGIESLVRKFTNIDKSVDKKY